MSTFSVDLVTKALEAIPSGAQYDVPEAVKRLTKGTRPEAFGSNAARVVPCYANGFVSALDFAYAQHYSLTLSPDDVWLTIAQSVAQHIDQHAETLRHHFVEHEGKVKITYQNDSLVMGSPDNPWMDGFDFFSKEIKRYIGKKHDLLVSNFSSTGVIEKAASEVVLMDAMKHYFEYGVCTLCGIPEINLLGTTEDWSSIQARVQALGELEGLKKWTQVLDPVLAEFVRASKGNVSKDFWSNIYKKTSGGSGGPRISGWANAFFLYLEIPRGRMINPLAMDLSASIYTTSNEFPSGLSQVPFTWNYYGVEHEYEFLGGFVGAAQEEDLSLRPAIGWAVRAKTG